MTQSIEANVIVSPYATRPAEESSWSFRESAGLAVRSCSSDQRFRKYATTSQTAK